MLIEAARACGGGCDVGAVGDWPVRRDPGVKLGASALSFVDVAAGEVAPGIATGAVPVAEGDWGDSVVEGGSILPLTWREPGLELVGDIALRSEIMRCRLLRASWP